MSDSDKIKLTVLPTETMHADLTWLLINPANMATKDQPVKQKDWVEVPTHVVRIEHPQRREADLGLRRPTGLPARPGRPVRDVLGPEGGAAARRLDDQFQGVGAARRASVTGGGCPRSACLPR